jgi:hypothetical protein
MMVGSVLTMTAGYGGQQEMPKSGFLSDYSNLKQEDPLKTVDWLYVNENVKFGSYNKIMLDHVVFFLKKDVEYKGIQADEMQELADAFHKAIVDALKDQYYLVDTPGPGVMQARIALTDLVPTKPGRGTITTIVPVGLVLSHVKKAATGSHIGMGEVSFEAELLDSQTNEVLAAVIDSQTGKKYKIGKTTTEWGHAKDIFKLWAKTFRKRLDKLSGRE